MNSVRPSKVRAVPTTYDILNACAWRLTGITSARYQLEMKAVGVWLEVCGELEDIQEDLPTLAPVLEVSPWFIDRLPCWHWTKKCPRGEPDGAWHVMLFGY
jgi:hypothetical protein